MYHDSDILFVLCVSSYDYEYLVSLCGLPSSKVLLISNFIEPSLHPLGVKSNLITYMPRKNYHFQQCFFSFFRYHGFHNQFHLKPIHNVDHSQVISSFQQSICFLNFGHPEGFGLPVAEALACANCVVGFNSHGTYDIYKAIEGRNIFFPSVFDDQIDFLNAFRNFVGRYNNDRSSLLVDLSASSRIIRSTFSLSEITKSLLHAFSLISSALPV